jgi:hypothetical protein
METTLHYARTLSKLLRAVLAMAAITFSPSLQAQLNSGQVPSNPDNESIVGQRYRALKVNGSNGNKEVFAGVTDLGSPSNRSDNDLNYKTSLTFSITYDPANDWFINVTVIDSNTKTIKTTITNAVTNAGKIHTLADLNYLQIEAKNQNNGSGIALANLKLNGNTIPGAYSNTTSGSKYWYLYATGMGSGFNLTGSVALSGNFGNAPDQNAIEFQFGYSPLAIALPLSWGDVSVYKTNSGTHIRWSTLQEVSTDRFDVERSGDNQNFTVIKTVTARGNSNAINWYEITDAVPVKGINYYRIKEIDHDNRINYSKTVAINLQGKNNMLVSVANNLLQLQFNTTGKRTVQVINTNGSVMKKEISTGSIYQADIASLPRGIYLVRVSNDDGSADTQKFFK